ncbi:sulfite exporter TauE/SafE family protein [Celerinatantimonas yamalensis]|uniref:Probable membrane transporter protein n=1 Tax=Celerinatantimonas yamalensis TaxID=559956 RepID=A0ABW9GAZ8_9GAMM
MGWARAQWPTQECAGILFVPMLLGRLLEVINNMFLICLGLGAFAGVLSGLFGLGGGVLIVPALVMVFHWAHFSSQLAIHMAMGTSLATIIVTATNSTYEHQKRGGIDWSIVRQMSVGIVFGALLGSIGAHFIDGELLEELFAIYLVLIALKMLLSRTQVHQRSMPAPWVSALVGGVIGFKSALFGVGGGTVSVPFLNYCGQSMKRAAGISAACGLPIALTGSLGYIISGWHQSNLPPWSIGYIYLPAWLGIVLTSAICARLGARLSHCWPQQRLQRLFALLLLAIAANILLS